MFILKYKFKYIEYELALATLFAMIGAQKLSVVDVKQNHHERNESPSHNYAKPVKQKDKLIHIMNSISKYTEQLNEFTSKFRMN